MTTETISNELNKPVLIERGYFYAVSKEGNVVRFKPGRKKKETQSSTVPSQTAAEAVAAVEVLVEGVLN